MTGLVVTAVLFPLAGWAAGRRSLAEAFLFGAGLLGAAMFILGVLNVPFVVTMTAVAVAGVVQLVLALSSRAEVARAIVPARSTATLTILTVVPLVLLALIVSIVPLHDFDGRAFWLLKAKALANERTVDGPFFHLRSSYDPRNEYPLLIPLDAAAVMIATRDADDPQVRWLYLFLFAALVVFVRRRIGPWYGAILAWLPQFSFAAEGGATSAYADIAIAAFVTAAVAEMIDGESPLRFGAWLSFLLLTKNEGLPIASVLLFIGAFRFRRRIGIAAIAPAVAAAALLVWRSGIPITDEENYAALLSSLPSRMGRILPAVWQFARHLVIFWNWGVVGIAAVVALALLAWRREWRMPAIAASMAALYIGAYAVTNWNMSDLVAASADRLLMQMIGPMLFAIAAVIGPNERSRYTPPERPPTPA